MTKEERINILNKVHKNEISPEDAYNLLFSPIIDYISKEMEEHWDDMGDTGSYDYEVNKENFNFGRFRALESFESKFFYGETDNSKD